MKKLIRYSFLWFSMITAAAAILGGLVFLDIPLYMQLLIFAFLAFFVYDAITERKKNKEESI